MSIQWFDTGPMPVRFGVCIDEGDYLRAMKLMEVPEPPPFLDGCPATCKTFEERHLPLVVIVTLDTAALRKAGRVNAANTAAHEASHAADDVFEFMQEEQPGTETRAYLVGFFTQCILDVLWSKKK